MSTCHACKRGLAVGEVAWASDWIVWDEMGPRYEIRFTCDECGAA